MLIPPLDKRNTRDKAKGLRTTSERYIGDRTLGNSLIWLDFATYVASPADLCWLWCHRAIRPTLYATGWALSVRRNASCLLYMGVSVGETLLAGLVGIDGYVALEDEAE